MSKEQSGPGVIMSGIRRVGHGLKTSLAIVSFATASGLYMEYRKYCPMEEDNNKKKVLVIPFHHLQLIEKEKKSIRSQLLHSDVDTKDCSVQMEIKDLVEVLHHAASDPSIVALYSIFGHGSTLSQAGLADLEEVWNTLQVIRKLHHWHTEPNLQHKAQVIPGVENKPMYAYADTFASLGDPANKEYYLALIFTHIHMQKTGELNLFGAMLQQFFLRGLLEQYGIALHVFKHGQYKNAPNMFTKACLNKPHCENVSNILEQINNNVCQDITRSRSKALLTSWLKQGCWDDMDLWKHIHQLGMFPAVMDIFNQYGTQHPVIQSILAKIGMSSVDDGEPYPQKETIALLRVNKGIGNSTAAS
jgi:hypothetical protein